MVERVSRLLAAFRHRRGRNTGGLCNSRFAGLCQPGGPSSPGRRVRILAGRTRLRLARIFTPTRRWSHLGHFSHDCRNGGCDGGWRHATLRSNCQPRGLYRSGAVRDFVGTTAQRPRQAGERQHSRRVQDRSGRYDRHEPNTEPTGSCRRRTQLFRSGRAVGGADRTEPLPRPRCRRRCNRSASARRAVAARTACRACHCRIVYRRGDTSGSSSTRRTCHG